MAKIPFELLTQFIDYCNSLEDSVVFIVEGKRDIEALKLIGIVLEERMIIARKGLPIEELVDQISKIKTIILLVDFDREGKHIRKVLKNSIQRRKGHGFIDPFPRRILYKFMSAVRITEIEELKQFIGKNPK